MFHVMNRAARRLQIFSSPADYRAFEELLMEALERTPVRLLAYAIMPNHFHLVVYPIGDWDLARFMQWLTRTHVQRWQLARRSVGSGTLYQGRYKAIPVQTDEHLLTVCRYVEQNPMVADLVRRATDWRWGSAWSGLVVDPRPPLSEWPVEKPSDWTERINGGGHLDDDLRESVRRGIPFGTAGWVRETAERLSLDSRLRGPGRPKMRPQIGSGGISISAT